MKAGHKVRIATHEAHRNFIEKEWGIEFVKIAGDPKALMKLYSVLNIIFTEPLIRCVEHELFTVGI